MPRQFDELSTTEIIAMATCYITSHLDEFAASHKIGFRFAIADIQFIAPSDASDNNNNDVFVIPSTIKLTLRGTDSSAVKRISLNMNEIYAYAEKQWASANAPKFPSPRGVHYHFFQDRTETFYDELESKLSLLTQPIEMQKDIPHFMRTYMRLPDTLKSRVLLGQTQEGRDLLFKEIGRQPSYEQESVAEIVRFREAEANDPRNDLDALLSLAKQEFRLGEIDDLKALFPEISSGMLGSRSAVPTLTKIDEDTFKLTLTSIFSNRGNPEPESETVNLSADDIKRTALQKLKRDLECKILEHFSQASNDSAAAYRP